MSSPPTQPIAISMNQLALDQHPSQVNPYSGATPSSPPNYGALPTHFSPPVAPGSTRPRRGSYGKPVTNYKLEETFFFPPRGQ